jgi:hypothetical protein
MTNLMTSDPQLDPDDPSGCITGRLAVIPDNLSEFTSYIIRRQCDSLYGSQYEKEGA